MKWHWQVSGQSGLLRAMLEYWWWRAVFLQLAQLCDLVAALMSYSMSLGPWLLSCLFTNLVQV